MSELLWSFDQLSRFTRYEDPEVRYWAADRLAMLFPDEASDVIADLILDEHDATPDLVAGHLGLHGERHHVPVLLRGFRKGTGLTPGRCIEALAALGYEGTHEAAKTALHQRDIPEAALGLMVSALAGVSAKKKGPSWEAAGDHAREFLLRRPELFAEPAALRGAIHLIAPADFHELIQKWITALHFRGPDQVESCIRVLIEELQLEDCGWCVRTDRTGRIDLDRTLRAVESGYDVDLRGAIPSGAREQLASQLQTGEFTKIVAGLGAYIESRARALTPRPTDILPARLESLGRAFQTTGIIKLAEQLETAMQQWLIGIMISGTVKVSIYRNYVLESEEAGEDLPALLALAGVESSCLLNSLPVRIARAAGTGPGRVQAIDWCLSTLEARGPFFPKALALDTLGTLGTADLVPEIAAHLADDNAYIYGAAERALTRIGEPVIDHVRMVMGRGGVQPEVLQSLLRVACELSHQNSLRLVMDHFDEIFETIGPEPASEAVGMLGHPDLVPNLRRWLGRAPALVGHALLLIGGINNLPIPEEESILKAIDDYWKGSPEGPDGGSGPSGQYLM